MKTYQDLIDQYKKPRFIAEALGITAPGDDYKTRSRASARVSMWKSQGVPVKYQIMLEEMEQNNT